MPSLKDLNCSIELTSPQKKLQEYGTTYADGAVETFIAVPNDQTPFAIRLTSASFIAPGLAMYVFIDGIYQCNRNRQNLKLHHPLGRRSLVDFCVRQKEERQRDGSMIARDWAFEKLDVASANEAPDICSANVLENIGCVEVVVLRCVGPRGAFQPAASQGAEKSSALGLDGACEMPEYAFDLDGRQRDWDGSGAAAHCDDRGLSQFRGRGRDSGGVGHASWAGGGRYGRRPSRSCRSSHVTIVNSPKESMARRVEGPIPGVQYGRGPVPPRDSTPSDPPFQDDAVSPEMLSPLPMDSEQDKQPPGAWPIPAFGPALQPHAPLRMSNDRKISWSPSDVGLAKPVRMDRTRGLVHSPQNDGWGSPAMDSSDSWAAEHTCVPQHKGRGGSSGEHQGRLASASNWDDSLSVQSSTVSAPRSERDRSHDPFCRNPRQAGSTWGRVSDLEGDSWSVMDSKSDTSSWAAQSGVVSPSEHKSWSAAAGGSRGRDLRPKYSDWGSTGMPSWDGGDDHGWTSVDDDDNRSARTSTCMSDTPAAPRLLLRKNDETPMGTAGFQAKPAFTTPPIPTWGCADPKKAGKRHGALTPQPPPYGLMLEGVFSAGSANERNVSGSSSSSSWNIPNESERDVTSTWGDAHTSPSPRKTPSIEGGIVGSRKSSPAVQSARIETSKGEKKARSIRSSKSNKSQTGGSADASNVRNSSWRVASSNKPHDHAYASSNKNEQVDTSNSKWEQSAGDSGKAENNKSDTNAKDGWVMDTTWPQDAFTPQDDPAAKEGKKSRDESNTDPKSQKDASRRGTGGFEETKAEDPKHKSGDAANKWGNPDTSNNQDNLWDLNKDNASKNQDNNGNIASWNIENAAPAWPTMTAANDSKSKTKLRSHKSKSKSKSNHQPEKHTKVSSRAHASKSKTYDSLRTVDTKAKPHWQFPPPSTKQTLYPIPEDSESVAPDGQEPRIWSVGAEPLHKIPREKAEEKMLEHQVRAGKGLKYTHAIGRPEYMDSLEKPYAIFRFKYRTLPALKKLLGLDVVVGAHPDTPSPEALRQKLTQVPQNELIDSLLKLKTQLEEKGAENVANKKSRATESVGRERVHSWVVQQSREQSANASVKGSAKAVDMGQGWGAGGGDRPGAKKGSQKASLKDGENREGDAWGPNGGDDGAKWEGNGAAGWDQKDNKGAEGGWGGDTAWGGAEEKEGGAGGWTMEDTGAPANTAW